MSANIILYCSDLSDTFCYWNVGNNFIIQDFLLTRNLIFTNNILLTVKFTTSFAKSFRAAWCNKWIFNGWSSLHMRYCLIYFVSNKFCGLFEPMKANIRLFQIVSIFYNMFKFVGNLRNPFFDCQYSVVVRCRHFKIWTLRDYINLQFAAIVNFLQKIIISLAWFTFSSGWWFICDFKEKPDESCPFCKKRFSTIYSWTKFPEIRV